MINTFILEVVKFHDVGYIDFIREVNMELMCMRVVANNIPKIIKTIKEKRTGTKFLATTTRIDL